MLSSLCDRVYKAGKYLDPREHLPTWRTPRTALAKAFPCKFTPTSGGGRPWGWGVNRPRRAEGGCCPWKRLTRLQSRSDLERWDPRSGA